MRTCLFNKTKGLFHLLFLQQGKVFYICSWLWRHALYVLKEQLYAALGWKPRNYAKHMYLRIVIVDNSLHDSYTETKTKFPLSEKYVYKNIYFLYSSQKRTESYLLIIRTSSMLFVNNIQEEFGGSMHAYHLLCWKLIAVFLFLIFF